MHQAALGAIQPWATSKQEFDAFVRLVWFPLRSRRRSRSRSTRKRTMSYTQSCLTSPILTRGTCRFKGPTTGCSSGEHHGTTDAR
jgi:hypothetical protein